MISKSWICCISLTGLLILPSDQVCAQDVINLWPEKPPGEAMNVGPEQDFTKPEDRLIAGARIIKLGNVATPEVHVYLPPKEKRTGAAVVICPGGGFNILAWDLEGTEVAEWLNTQGIAGVVLKYRVPTGQQNPRWKAPVQDAQRAMSLTRHHVKDWGLDPEKIGILGFSAGGHTAARAAIMTERQYEPIDEIDESSHLPNAAILIYPAWLANEEGTGLLDDLHVTKETPPMFLVHAYDDRVSPLSSALLFVELKKAEVPAEIHVYESGGHGYGLRNVDDQPVTRWTNACHEWLARLGWSSGG